uniref:Uncharacterized protein n=1 Tax=Megaselia scalaris TaxID=36166 RepID=T1GQ71_MEGSC
MVKARKLKFGTECTKARVRQCPSLVLVEVYKDSSKEREEAKASLVEEDIDSKVKEVRQILNSAAQEKDVTWEKYKNGKRDLCYIIGWAKKDSWVSFLRRHQKC